MGQGASATRRGQKLARKRRKPVAYAHANADRKTRSRRAAAPVSLNWPVLGAVAFSAAAWFAIVDLGRRLF